MHPQQNESARHAHVHMARETRFQHPSTPFQPWNDAGPGWARRGHQVRKVICNWTAHTRARWRRIHTLQRRPVLGARDRFAAHLQGWAGAQVLGQTKREADAPCGRQMDAPLHHRSALTTTQYTSAGVYPFHKFVRLHTEHVLYLTDLGTPASPA